MIVVQVAGYSSSGKTEVCLRLAECATAEGPVGYVKSHHGELERPFSDTGRMGAHASLRLLAGSDGTLRLGGRPTLEELVAEARSAGCAVVLVEGFKFAEGPKTWLRRDAQDVPPQGVTGVALDMLGAQAISLEAQVLWRIVPRRER